MTTTEYLGLKKPGFPDPIDISVLNENADTLDAFAEETGAALAAVTAAQQQQSGEIGTLANAGAKNYLRQDSYRGQSAGDEVTWTWNQSDGTIRAQIGAAPLPASRVYQLNVTVTEAGMYTFTCGENSGGASYPYDCYLHNPATSSTAIRDYGAEQTKQLAAGTYRLDIRIRAGVSNFDKTFKPMLRPAVLTDTEYVPYAPTNRALYEMILAMQNRS
ncbi:MAG: hypothetical protein IKS42_09410 [Oscillospiraceae bacterium]|nr:hypothetical protein [Oscillospiraceae bacterium]